MLNMQVAKMFPVRKGSHPGKLLDHSPATSISLSKLADESQLGSLSKLLTPAHNNNVNDCNFENWTSEVPVEPVTNSCTQRYETALQYKSFMPLKKRFRQDFGNHIIKESPPPIQVEAVVNNQISTNETNAVNLLKETDVTPELHCPTKADALSSSDKMNEETQEARTTKFRACKGERYKMFMNSNRRTRNKTNRWDLRQKSMPNDKLALVGEMEIQQRISDFSNLDMEDYNKSHFRNKKPKRINKTKRKKRQLSPAKSSNYLESMECNKNEIEDYLEMSTEEKKSVKEENTDSKEEIGLAVQYNGDNLLNNKENGIFKADNNQTNLIEEIKIENELKTINEDVTAENLENKTGIVVGSRKRKLRKQNIKRLQPGSTFKDTRVVEDSVVCDLGTLAEVAVSTEQKAPN